MSVFFPLWEPCAYMLAVQSHQLSAFLTEGPLFQTAKLKRESLIKSHWDQYSQLVQGLMPFHNTPYRKSLEIHSWLISTAGALWQGRVGTGQAWREFFSHWLKLVHQDPDFIQQICVSHSRKQHYFLTDFWTTEASPSSILELSVNSYNGKRQKSNFLFFQKWAE